ncbi:YcxB family protein [Bacillus sp. MRMR6]|uniref:YcxB family protein n=1 Tax=Bacillus sp. MRMR6 TaxID=1928617 RepID=UPI0020CA0AE5|nr:YcxB family protein [Bacillus sp. MRMR6]
MGMEIKYNLSEEDYLKFNLFHVKNSETAKKSLKMQRYATPIIYIIIAYVFANLADIPFLYTFLPFAFIGGLWSIFYPKYFYNHIKRQTKKMIAEGKNDGLLGRHTMNLSEEGIVDTTANGETKVNWSGIIKYKEDDATLYLYNSSVSAYIIPKRDIPNIEELKTFLNEKLSHREKP